MCVIVYKPRGEKKIPKRIFKECWINNSDGAGYAYWNESIGKWSVRKGLMSFRKFWHSYREHKFGEDDIVLIHFRIGTSGGDTAELTHPFPVIEDLSKMGELKYDADNIVFHNGVIGFSAKDKDGKSWSDTCVAIAEIIDPLHPYLDDDKIFNYISDPLESHQSKWVITKGSNIFQYGKWLIDNGIEYSNATYKES